ncbi:MAG: 5-formyltetrahydrofolate cyclo-ligase [Gammaproteobacteria bacterium]|jgi:5-formyltetrahydrofolate cyclo-ligase|nr:5-formyltetrahydrofolate cyclo-ligase [Gammaproteobacteria bacterium]
MPFNGTSDPDTTRATKGAIRRDVIARRRSQPRGLARALSRAAVRRAWRLPALARASAIAIYLPAQGELDCTPLAVQAWGRGRSVYVPVIDGKDLRFAPFHARSDLRANRFGLLEPVCARRNLRTARELDVIVAPLVAFDPEGRRLGMGGGFYDRALAHRQRFSRARRPHFIALAFELQKHPGLPIERWDVRLDAVVTESATYRFA